MFILSLSWFVKDVFIVGVGSQSSIEGKTVKPFNIQDLDMSKPEDRLKYAEYRKKRDMAPVQINNNLNKYKRNVKYRKHV